MQLHESLAAIDVAKEQTLLLDAETDRFVHANSESLDFFEQSLDQICVLGFHALGFSLKPDLLQTAIEEALSGGNPVIDTSYQKDTQKTVPCTLRFLRCPPYGRKLVKIIIISQNRGEFLLEKYEKELSYQASLLDRVSDAIISTDADYKIRSWNQAAQEMYGWKMEEVIGMPIGQVLRISYPKTISGEEVLAEFTKNKEWKGEVITYNKAKESLQILASVKAFLDEDGKLAGGIAIHTDITEWKVAEKELRATQQELITLTERLQLANEVFQVGIWDWDLNQDTIVWDENMYKLYGFQKDEIDITFKSWQSFVHPEDLEELLRLTKKALQEKDNIETEARIIWPDRSIHHIRTNVIVQRNESGLVSRMIGTSRDVTAEKEAEQQKIHARLLEAKNRELEHFTYMASHDLKEPLRTIIGFTSLLQKRHQKKLLQIEKEYLDYISKAAYRMDALIKGLLDYSKIGINQEQTIVDLKVITHHIMDDLSMQISESQAIIQVGDLPKIKGFETELRVLFQNLISNAIKFRQPDTIPQIRISAQKKEDHWELCFTDNGIGIEAQHWERIFTVFQRLHASDTYEGTGIGLAHCQKIAELHGGRIWITSEVGQGSSFYVSLPALV